MADQSNRPYSSNPNYRPSTPAGSSSNDPLAELARLIGQTDPFAEFGRDGRRVSQSAPGAEQPAEWGGAQGTQYATAPVAPGLRAGVDPIYTQYDQQHGQGEPTFAAEGYSAGYEQQGYDTQGNAQQSQNFHQAGYYDGKAARGDDDIYDDVPPARRRISVIAIAAIFALAVLGTAGAVGYRALFGTSGSSPPPVIKADSAPSKIVPPSSSEPQSNKLITDRVGGPGEKLVSREERPVEFRDRPPQSIFPGTQSGAAAVASVVTGSGVVGGTEPKRVRTIAIRPDQPQGIADTSPPAPVRAAATPPLPRSSPAVRSVAPEAEEAAPRPVARAAQPVAPSSNAPMSLNPDAQPAASRAAPAPPRTAAAPVCAVPATAAAAGTGGGYAVQVSSQRSEADAQAAYRALQGKFASQLANRPSFIKRADLGDKGTYYRAMIGPFGSAEEASELCNALKAAGGDCLIQRN